MILCAFQANCLAVHEFGKELESRVGRTQFVSVLVFAAYTSGLVMIATGQPVGAEAYLPVGASGMGLQTQLRLSKSCQSS